MKWQMTLPFRRDEVMHEGSLHIVTYPDDVDSKPDRETEQPRSRAADDFAVIRQRLEELRKEELKPKDVEALKVMTVDCVWCGAGDTEEAGRMCSGACGH